MRVRQIVFDAKDGGQVTIASDLDEQVITVTYGMWRIVKVPMTTVRDWTDEFVNENVAPLLVGDTCGSAKKQFDLVNLISFLVQTDA